MTLTRTMSHWTVGKLRDDLYREVRTFIQVRHLIGWMSYNKPILIPCRKIIEAIQQSPTGKLRLVS